MATKNERVEGKVIGVKADGSFLRCQADATLNITINTETDDPCKALDYTGTDLGGIKTIIDWEDASVSTGAWTIDVSKSMFYDSIEGDVDFIDEVLNKDNAIFGVQFVIPSNGAGTSSKIFEGDAILTSIALGAPSSGKATEDLSFQGKGKPTWTKVSLPTV